MVLDAFEISFFTPIAYQLTLILTKYSILAFYLRVFPAKRERWLTWGTITFVAMFGTTLVAANIFQCNPVTGAPIIAANITCIATRPLINTSFVLHTIADGWMILIIIPVVSNLNIPRKQKWALMGVLSLGIFEITASIIRIAALLSVSDSQDITWDIAKFDVWSAIECCVGIVCACAPTIRPLLHKLFPDSMAGGPGTKEIHTTDRPASSIAFGSGNLKTEISDIRKPPFVFEREGRKDSWVHDKPERKLVVKKGLAVPREGGEDTSTSPRPVSPLMRNPSTGRGDRASVVAPMRLEESHSRLPPML